MLQLWNQSIIDQAASIPPMLAALLFVGGVIVMLLGWRLSRLVTTFDFSIFGLVVGSMLGMNSELQWLSAGGGAIAFGLLSLWMDQHSEAVAGGLIASLVAAMVMGWLQAPLAATLLVIVVAFGLATAFCVIVVREATAVMTAVQGGLIAAFGLAGCLANHNWMWHDLRGVLASSDLALLMFLAAPVGIGITFQLAAIQNEEVMAR